VYATWCATLAEAPGRPARILAWTPSVGEDLVVLSPSVLSVRTGDDWRHVGWHLIERGGWNAETAQLRWQTYAGSRGAVTLPDPSRVPEVFKERVDASVVFERFVPIAAGSDRGVVINARRSLAAGQDGIDWRVTLTRGVTWGTPGLRELTDTTLAELRREYDEG
jgi:hypothetical protein